MEISVSFTLLLLLGAVVPSENVESQQPFPQDIYAALKEMTASLVQLKADMTLLQRETQEQAALLNTVVDKLNQQPKATEAPLVAGAVPPATSVVDGDVMADLPAPLVVPMVAILPVAVDLPGTVAQGTPVVVIPLLIDGPSTSGDEAMSTQKQINDQSKINEGVNTVEVNEIVSVSLDLLVDDEEMSDEEGLKIAQKRTLINSVPNHSNAKKTSTTHSTRVRK
ncbi:hypothetical protein PFLUV_G00185650 [Perca fluviatilis]|uniref:Uncharacterized protein n=1 Tax=Perca fluviatilis TaxID=8168 RepID=A0A6A5EIB3_PERFL|nr:hypothetical protein PFLUV_G00185650 [Perca fluviatilis]